MSRKRTTSELFNLTPDERTALINTVAGEAYQGGGGEDIAAVTANLLSRKLSKYNGMNNIVDLVTAPGQYAANDSTSRNQIINPGLISAFDRERIAKIVDNPSMVLNEYMAGGGPVSFRGTSLYKNRRGDEYTHIEGSSNFYFDPLKTLNQTPTQTAAATTQNTSGIQEDPKTPGYNPKKFVMDFIKNQILALNSEQEKLNQQVMQQSNAPISAKKAIEFFGGFD